MALIQGKISNGQYGRRDDKNDLHLVITAQRNGKIFDFRVQRNRVEVTCKNPDDYRYMPPKDDKAQANNWQTALSEEEKLRVFALILDEYRKHSIGDEYGYRGAALGIANGQIFLGANTANGQLASPYFKDCAEQNMVNAASDLIAYQKVKKDGWDTQKRPEAPKFEAVYMMGGVDQNRIPVSCPCGKCTDMLAKNMAKGGAVYTLPILTPEMFRQLDNNADVQHYLSCNNTANNLGEVNFAPVLSAAETAKPQAQIVLAEPTPPPSNLTSKEQKKFAAKQARMAARANERREERSEAAVPAKPYVVWKTSIDHLNADREVTDNALPQVQRDGLKELLRQAEKIGGLREEAAEVSYDKAINAQRGSLYEVANMRQLFHAIVAPIGTVLERSGLRKRAQEILGNMRGASVKAAAENQFLERRSIAELDAQTVDGEVPLGAINQYMLKELRHALADRIRAAEEKDGDIHVGKTWLRASIPQLRCVVVQLNDGTFASAMEASGAFDTALPHAEVAAVAQVAASLGRARILHTWVMEVNPDAIKRGVLPTSPKEGIERIVKRGVLPNPVAEDYADGGKASKGVDFTFIPLNDGKLSEKELADVVKPYEAQNIFPALFLGSRPLGAQPHKPPEFWTNFLNQHAANDEQFQRAANQRG